MAVPNTNTFSLLDVVSEISGVKILDASQQVAVNDLQACFNNAVASAFDPAYGSITDNDMLAFRNYNNINKNYYRMNPCIGAGTFYTLVPPEAPIQRYVNSSGGAFYTWNGTFITQSTPPTGFISTIQKVTGQTGCP